MMGNTEQTTNNQEQTTAPFIKLDRYLKWQGIVQTGGEAKVRIQAGEVIVNGRIETRRGKKLRTGDRVSIANKTYTVNLERGTRNKEKSWI